MTLRPRNSPFDHHMPNAADEEESRRIRRRKADCFFIKSLGSFLLLIFFLVSWRTLFILAGIIIEDQVPSEWKQLICPAPVKIPENCTLHWRLPAATFSRFWFSPPIRSHFDEIVTSNCLVLDNSDSEGITCDFEFGQVGQIISGLGCPISISQRFESGTRESLVDFLLPLNEIIPSIRLLNLIFPWKEIYGPDLFWLGSTPLTLAISCSSSSDHSSSSLSGFSLQRQTKVERDFSFFFSVEFFFSNQTAN